MLTALALALTLACSVPKTKTPTAAIDLNSAPAARLMQLPGIGAKRAEDIVKARKQRPFQHVRDLLRVKGIGKKTLAKLLPFVRADKPDLRRPKP
jgi:competence ComEA-like helix-hairpin-helix protein